VHAPVLLPWPRAPSATCSPARARRPA